MPQDMIKIEGKTDFEIMEQFWKAMTLNEKQELLELKGYDISWTAAPDFNDMINKGGLEIVESLVNVWIRHKESIYNQLEIDERHKANQS